MAFAEGQQVRIKQGQQVGRIAKKLTYIDDMYVVVVDGKVAPEKKIAHGSDLELLSPTQPSASDS